MLMSKQSNVVLNLKRFISDEPPDPTYARKSSKSRQFFLMTKRSKCISNTCPT